MWEKIVNNLATQLTRPQLESWIKPIKFLEANDKTIFLAVPSDYYKNWIEKNLSKDISRAILEVVGTELKPVFTIDPELKAGNLPSGEDNRTTSSAESGGSFTDNRIDALKRVHQNLNLKYTFDSFVVGPNNRFAYEMAKVVGNNPGKAHNPLFIYGGVGLGKTHLMQAIGHQVYQKFRQKKIKYINTESFTNEFIESIRRQSGSDFRANYRQIDLLLIDDIQFLEGKESTQEEMFNTFKLKRIER